MNVKKLESENGLVLVQVEGQINADTSSSVRDELGNSFDEAEAMLLIDMSKVEFIDSSGLSALVSVHKILNSKGSVLALLQPQSQAQTALRLTMLDKVFKVFFSREEADEFLAAVEGSA